MDVYTANQLQRLVDAVYERGLQDAKLRLDGKNKPPALLEFIEHSYQGGVYEPETR